MLLAVQCPCLLPFSNWTLQCGSHHHKGGWRIWWMQRFQSQMTCHLECHHLVNAQRKGFKTHKRNQHGVTGVRMSYTMWWRYTWIWKQNELVRSLLPSQVNQYLMEDNYVQRILQCALVATRNTSPILFSQSPLQVSSLPEVIYTS